MLQRLSVKIVLAGLAVLAASSASASDWSLDAGALEDGRFQARAAADWRTDMQPVLSGVGRRNERAMARMESLAGLDDFPTAASVPAAEYSSALELLGSPLTASASDLVDCFGGSQGLYRLSLCRRGVTLSAAALKRMLGPDTRFSVGAAPPAVPLPAGLPLLICGLALLATRARRHAPR